MEWNHISVLPDGFLGGSAPCLKAIYLRGVPFPALPTLLLSTHNLIRLELVGIPRLVTFRPRRWLWDWAHCPGSKHFTLNSHLPLPALPKFAQPLPALPALTQFDFKGPSKYLEDLVAYIDSPQLLLFQIDFLNQLVDFQVARLSKFIDRSVGPKLSPLKRAQVTFSMFDVSFDLWRHVNYPRQKIWNGRPMTAIKCEGIDWQVSHMAQVFSHFSITLPNVVHLELDARPEGHSLKDTDDAEWLHLLQQFPTVQTLHVSQELAGYIALALEDVTGGMVVEVLPSLDLIYLAGQPALSIHKFVAFRQLSGRPVTAFDTQTEFDERLGSYVGK
jgi:hypothetical protein